MADITLSISKDGLTPSVVDVARAETVSVDFSGLEAWANAYEVEDGIVYAQQFDALKRPLGEEAFGLDAFTLTLEPGVSIIDFRVRASGTLVSGGAVHDFLSDFPVKVCSPSSDDGGSEGGETVH